MKEDVSVKVSRALQAIAQSIASTFKDVCNCDVPFSFFVFTPQRFNYIRDVNTTRETEIEQIQKLFKIWETGAKVGSSSPHALGVASLLPEMGSLLDGIIEEVAGVKVGWALIVYDESRPMYISTSHRTDVVRVLTEIINGWEQGLPDIPAHQVH